MIRKLAGLKGIGPELATLLAWEAFVRPFRNRRALAGYAGLAGTPFDSGGRQREQGIGKGRAIVACAPPWSSWLGCGCAISRTARSPLGSDAARKPRAAAPAK